MHATQLLVVVQHGSGGSGSGQCTAADARTGTGTCIMAALRRLLLCAALQTCVALSARTACRPCAPQAEPLKWIIVGGGPHGVHIATALLQQVPGSA